VVEAYIALVEGDQDVFGGTVPEVWVANVHEPRIIEVEYDRGVFGSTERPHPGLIARIALC